MKRRWLRWLIFYPLLFAMIFGAVAAGVWIAEKRAGQMIKNTPDFEKARTILASNAPQDDSFFELSGQRVIAAPYLQYIPQPSSNLLLTGHNPQGYRGPAVPLDRTPGVARILFLGGSTTYGWAVPNWENAYPPQIQKMLKEKGLPPGITDIEIINAGLPAGVTAETLTHYHFKYHYYAPDIVVLEAGGNDADPHNRSYYTPDFSHFRPAMTNLRPLPEDYRWVMKSNILALFMLRCTNLDFYRNQNVATNLGTKPPSVWFTKPDGSPWQESETIPDERLAFAHNMRALIGEIRDDHALLLLTPFRANPHTPTHYPPSIHAYFDRFAGLMEKMAAENNASFAPFPAATLVPKDNWSDPCHLNEAGERQKAEYLLPFVADLLARLPADQVGKPRQP